MIKKLSMYKGKPVSLLIYILVILSAFITFGITLLILCYIFIKGIPYITTDLFAWNYTSDNVSLTPALVNTLIIVVLSIAVSAPLGIFSAVYLVEYSKRGSKIVSVIRMTAETLSGIPSIVYGLFGMLFFVTYLKFGYSILAGSLTLSIMILPLIMRTTEEALLSVPDIYREGSFGLGAGRLRTVFRVVLPSAIPGILSGIVLATGRIVGETAALIYTSGSVAKVPDDIMSSGRTLAVHMYALSGEGFNTDKAYAAAVVLIFFVILINALSDYIAKKLMKGH